MAPVWADQDGRGTHVNLSGLGVVQGTDQRRRRARADRVPHRAGAAGGVRAEQPRVRGRSGRGAAAEIAQFGDFKRDPIDVDGAGAQLDDALRLMDEVGWD